MTITREDLQRERQWRHTSHIDFAQSFQNWYRHVTWPRLTCVVSHPRGRRSKIKFSKRFFVDGIEVMTCTELLEALNKPQLAIVAADREVAA
jgi:hypothetical protein